MASAAGQGKRRAARLLVKQVSQEINLDLHWWSHLKLAASKWRAEQGWTGGKRTPSSELEVRAREPLPLHG